jgi:hypothetical protein
MGPKSGGSKASILRWASNADLAHGRAGSQGDDQLLGRIVDDAAQARDVEHLVASHRPAE